jgi:hypothetical protein
MRAFNEAEWIKMLFLLSDTQHWLDDMSRNCLLQLPGNKKKVFRQDYHLTVQAFAHILERHYYKINRHPQVGKFHIPVADILELLRNMYSIVPQPINNSCNFYRMMDTGAAIGFDKYGNSTGFITVITSKDGNIVTAFPGRLGQLPV